MVICLTGNNLLGFIIKLSEPSLDENFEDLVLEENNQTNEIISSKSRECSSEHVHYLEHYKCTL